MLLRSMDLRVDSTRNKDMVYQLIISGGITDPYPHFLRKQKDNLVDWMLALLAAKLNAMLEYETSQRPKKKLIRSVKPGTRDDHEDLAK